MARFRFGRTSYGTARSKRATRFGTSLTGPRSRRRLRRIGRRR